MLRNLSRTILLAAAVSAGALGVTASQASAETLRFGVTIGSGGVDVVDYRRGDRRYDDRRADVCEPRRALRKARDLGVRDAELVRANRRAVVVDGYKRGEPIRVRFAQERGCPVLAVR